MSSRDFLARSGLDSAELAEPDGRITLAKHARAFDQLTKLLAPSGSASPFGELAPLQEEAPLLTSAWLNAPSARHAVEAFVRFRAILCDTVPLSLQANGETLRISYGPEGPEWFASVSAQATLATFVEVIRSYDQGLATEFRIQLTAERPTRYLLALEPRSVSCGGRTNWLEIPTARLDVPSNHHNADLLRVTHRTLTTQLADMHKWGRFSHKVELLLRQLFDAQVGSGIPAVVDLERVCAHFGLSRRVLSSLLAMEGLTYRGIRAVVRLQQARRLLQDTTLPVAEIGEVLGFDRHTSFTRLFTSLQGMSPLQYRKLHRGRIPFANARPVDRVAPVA
jgi:AraC-like DNA-binding protein